MLEIDFSDRKIKNFQSKYQARVLIEQFFVILNFSVVFSTLFRTLFTFTLPFFYENLITKLTIILRKNQHT